MSDIEKQRRAMLHSFTECFRSEPGQIVLAALKSEYYDNYIPQELDEMTAMRLIGQRDVIHHILSLIDNVED